MTILRLAHGFWVHLTSRRKQQLGVLLVLMIVASFAEVLSLGAVLPFLSVLTQPDRIFSYPALRPILEWLRIESPQELLLPVTLGFIAAALLAGGMRLLLLYVSTKLSYAIGADFSYQIYRRTLFQPYATHMSRNSSEIIGGVTNKVGLIITSLMVPILTLISSAIILVAILVALVAVDPWMSLAAFVGFGTIYSVVILTTRKRLSLYSQRIARDADRVIKVLQEGLGGIRDVLIDGTQETYCLQYKQADIPLRHAQANSAIIGSSPRFAAEALGMVFIAVLAYIMANQEGGIANAITLLGVLALGAQRMLPVLQQGYQSMIQLRSGRHSLQDALALLDQPMDLALHEQKDVYLPFNNKIELRDLSFCYVPEDAWVLKGVSLCIPHGSRIGFIGTTGSGKSTLLDIIMGLLTPTQGGVWIDDVELTPVTQRAWQNRIAHVPQSIYLADTSIAENIAFGLSPDKIDRSKVRLAAQQAQIASYIESLPAGYDTHVGERGVRLSGGQRQRIGIARALYKRADIIIFDEATSALDNETERAVMDAIDGLGKELTILIIAHRLSTLKHCNQLVELSGGHAVRIGTYHEMIGNSPDFTESTRN